MGVSVKIIIEKLKNNNNGSKVKKQQAPFLKYLSTNFIIAKDGYMWVHYTIHLYFSVCTKSPLQNLVMSILTASIILVIN